MTAKTVRVPPEMAPLFERAERIVAEYFSDRTDDPERGTIEISGERYVLVRAAALSVEFFALVVDLYGPGREAEAEEFTQNILFDLAHAVGKSDARNFHTRVGLDDPMARLSAGPIHFAHAGWAFVDISPDSRPERGEGFYMLYDHPYSFESDAWIRSGKRRAASACIMNAGYSSGWCEESFGTTLVATEVMCRAKGDAACRFIMAHPAAIERHLARYLAAAPPPVRASASTHVPDFFARKRVEEELRRVQADLERRVAARTTELSAANERLRAEMAERERVEKKLRQTHKLEAIGRLAGGIAHDFNNLMGVVIGRAGLLEKRVGDDAARADVEVILGAGMQAAALTQQLLAFSRGQLLRPELLDLNFVVTQFGRMVKPLVGEDIEVTTTIGEDAGFVRADKSQLEQVLMNLVVNARDAMPNGGRLSIDTRRVDVAPGAGGADDLAPGAYVALTVSDTGVGMSDETIAQIFDPFFTTKGDASGTGLGLSTVYGIVKQSGGTIGVTSEAGAGSRFTIHLPRVDDTGGAESIGAAKSVPGSGVVLLVEDQPELRAVITEILEGAGYAVRAAASGAEALAIARDIEGPIDLLLTDVVMPRMKGTEVARAVLADRPGTPVLFMTGYAEASRDGEPPAIAPATTLKKPFTREELTARVRAAMRPR
jgi:signal transduction histidine kinase/CheY-like chemotaxis protein